MFSNKRTNSLIALGCSLVLLLAGCGIRLGEKVPEPASVAYSGKNYSCLAQIPQHLELYISDQLGEPEITDFIRCIQKSFTSFAQLTRGRDQSSYAPDEIRRFLENYFLKDRKISDELLHEFMVIKQALVGGDNELIARTELFDAIELLEEIRLEAIRLKPHLKYLNTKLIAKQDPRDLGQHLGEANTALKQSIQVFANRLQKSKKVYPLANLESFLTEFRIFARWEDHFKQAHPVKDWVVLLKAFKEVTVSPVEGDLIHEGDWVPLLQAMSGWYLAYLQYKVGIKGQPVLYGVGLQNTLYLADEVFDLTRTAVKRQPNKTITFAEMTQLSQAMHDIGWIPKGIRVTSLDQTMRAVMARIMGDQATPPADRRAEGMDLKSLASMEAEFYRWAYVQLSLDSRFKGETPVIDDFVPSLQSRTGLNPDIRARINSLKGSDWDEFIKVKSLIRPLFPEDRPRVQLVPDSELSRFGLKHGFYNLSAMNILRSVVELVFRGYSEGNTSRWLWTSGIKGPELQNFYVDFRDIGIDLGWIDKRNTNSGSRAFVEGKLFTSSSTGLKLDSNGAALNDLSFVEAMEYFAFLYSGGQMSDDLYAQLSTDCASGPLDINGLPKVSRSCAENMFPALIDSYMENMPYLQAYLRASSSSNRLAYAQILLDTARNPASDNNWVERNELSTVAVVTHYAESVMTRFDRNQDGQLTNDELEAAVPLFNGFIKKIAKDKLNQNLSDSQARAAFFYILKFKSIPASAVDFAYVWKMEWWEPKLSLDRYQLAQVFKAIIARIMEVGKKPLPPPPPPPPSSVPCWGLEGVLLSSCPSPAGS